MPVLVDVREHLTFTPHDVFNGGAYAFGAARPHADQAARMVGVLRDGIDAHALAEEGMLGEALVHQFNEALGSDDRLIHCMLLRPCPPCPFLGAAWRPGQLRPGI
ncbi:hypothetical protein D3C80_1977360 [compost metagenome]